MRFFIVSKEMPAESGVVVGRPAESRAKAVAEQCLREACARSRKVGSLPEVFSSLLLGPSLDRATRAFMGENLPLQRLADDALLAAENAYRIGLKEQNAEGFRPRILGGALISDDHTSILSHTLPFEQHCVTVTLHGGTTAPVPAEIKLFCGAFASDAQLNAVLAEDGYNSRIHIFNHDVARGLFKRHGGGILDDGVYLLHPKRDDVLVPFRTFHTDMLQEMTREVRVVMGRIGARKLVVETVEGVTFSGSVVSRVPLKSGGIEFEAKESAERRMAYEWGSPTFEPERALEDCVWIRDNAGAMTIIDQRRTSDLVRFEEFSKVDTSFRLGLNVMQLFEAKFAWASTSTYRYAVDFFPRR